MHLFFLLFLLWAQKSPIDLYYEGKIDAYRKKTQKAYTQNLKRYGVRELSTLEAGLSYARALYAQGAYLAADSLLNQFEPLVEKSTQVDKNLRIEFYLLRYESYAAHGKLKQALQQLQKTQEVGPNSLQQGEINLGKAYTLLLAENGIEALKFLQQNPPPQEAPEKQKNFYQERWQAYYTLATWQKGDWQAYDSLVKAWLKPTTFRKTGWYNLYTTEILYRWAHTAWLKGQYNTALQRIQKALSLSKKYPDLHLRNLTTQAYFYALYPSAAKRKKSLTLINQFYGKMAQDKLLPSPALGEAYYYAAQSYARVRRYPYALSIAGKGYQKRTLNSIFDAWIALVNTELNWLLARHTNARNAIAQANPNAFLPDAPTVWRVQLQAHQAEALRKNFEIQQADLLARKNLNDIHLLGMPAHPWVMRAYERYAYLAAYQGYYAYAESLYTDLAAQQKLALSEKSIDYIRTILALAQVQIDLGKYTAALSLLAQIEKLLEPIEDVYVREKVQYLELMGNALELQGDLRKAEKSYLAALRLREKKLGEVAQENFTLLKLAVLYQKTGRFSQAQVIYNRIFNIYQQTQKKDEEALLFYIGIVGFYLQIGDYLKAEKIAQEALQLAKTLRGEESIAYVTALSTSAQVDLALGRQDKAFTKVQKAYELQRKFYKGTPHLNIARTQLLLAQLHLAQGEEEMGEKLLGDALQEARAAASNPNLEYAQILIQASSVYLVVKKLPEAEKAFEEGYGILRNELPEKNPEVINAQFTRSALYKAQGLYIQAATNYKNTLLRWEKIYSQRHPEYPLHQANLAEIYWMAGNNPAAKKYYLQAVNGILKQVDLIFNGLTESEKAKYWSRIQNHLSKFYAFSFQSKDKKLHEVAYNTHLSTKALILSETGQLRQKVQQSPDTTLRRIYQEWLTQKEYVIQLYSTSNEELAQQKISLSQEEDRLNALEKQLVSYTGELSLPRLTWRELLPKVSYQQALVDILRVQYPHSMDSIAYYAVILDSTTKRNPKIIFLGNKDLEVQKALAYARNMMNLEPDSLSGIFFWKPIQDALPPQVQRVYVSNDGVYNQISLPSLRVEKGYVVDKYQIIYVTRMASLLQSRPLKYYEGRKAIIFADPDFNGDLPSDSFFVAPLPGTSEEAKKIAQILQSAGYLVQSYNKRYASENKAYAVQSPLILHVATHGLFIPYVEGLADVLGIQSDALRNPLLRASLLLTDAAKTLYRGSDDPAQDGMLNAYEILSLDLSNTDLVALSACETGIGEIKNGEGVYGLQRAFFLAGARSLIVSLWRVSDEAARDFMVTFYEEWIQKKLSKEQAFYNAQKATRKKYDHPFFWGAFIFTL
ncbi:MAG: CHAT domain-containing protein [Bacteroidia bacterium]